MNLTTVLAFVLAAVGAIASPVVDKRQSCAEAAQFGVLEIVPSDLQPGTGFTVHIDYACAVELGVVPTYIDTYIEVPEGNNGHEPPILLDRRTFVLSPPPLTQALTFTASFPYYPVLFEGAQYTIGVHTIYPINGTDGNPILIEGIVYGDINVTTS
ncbi:uncharacterized protein BT62DRAFT_923428 [Guyanagaster necrorhizus]|uniref:Uncharacterized protein n=1 Tax=Guyanagaster necrorhizus TaxID=856835 RepID=A0A9P7VIR9_9AGAR|nr:uncharacterized protein BT62DRAFT_923428 [Guyanagaster necrorhizus MCA 3950]KAG7441338.1 hypothetical protein BT62DRAFT_923428 [Guyanagaster necrorhizus MCA 3950]